MYLTVKSGYEAQQARFDAERTDLTGAHPGPRGHARAGDRAGGRARGDARHRARRGRRSRGAARSAIETAPARAQPEHGDARRARAGPQQGRGGARPGAAAARRSSSRADSRRPVGRLNQRLSVLGAARGRPRRGARAASASSSSGRSSCRPRSSGSSRRAASSRRSSARSTSSSRRWPGSRPRRATELEKVLSQLASAQQTLGQAEARLDKALLAQSVAELAGSRDALREARSRTSTPSSQHKQPLFGRCVSVNQELREPRRAAALADHAARRPDRRAAGAGRAARREPGRARAGEPRRPQHDSLAKLIKD